MSTLYYSSKTLVLALFCFLYVTASGNEIKTTTDKYQFAGILQKDTSFQVAYKETGPWLPAISIEPDKRLSLWYKISLDGKTDTIRLVFPIHIKGDTYSRPKSMAMMTNDDWEGVELRGRGLHKNDVVKDNERPGVVKFWDLNGKTEIVFQLFGELNDTLSVMSVGADCVIQKKDGKESKIILTKKLAKPVIASFTTERSVLVSGEFPTLSWNVVDADEIKIYKNSNFSKALFESSKRQSSWDEKNKPNTHTDYTLKTFAGGNEGHSKEISVKIFTNSQVAIEANIFNGQKLMGLYRHPMDPDNKMIALIMHDNLGTPNVLIWESEDGLTWQKSMIDNRIIAFQDSTNKNNVPLEFAGSPGVVFNKKLYLIGGSRFDPNRRSNAVYYYNFQDTGKGWQKGQDGGFTPRMGHSCVVYNKEIWVIGGSDKGGATDDCWIFSKGKWDDSQKKLPGRKCMASAIVIQSREELDKGRPGKIQLFGGFGDLPGVPDQTLKDAYVFDGSSWNSIKWANKLIDKKYSAFSLLSCKGDRFILSRKYEAGKYTNELEIINQNRVDDFKRDVSEIRVYDSFYNIQPLTFKGVVWMCIITQNGEPKSDANIRYFVNTIPQNKN